MSANFSIRPADMRDPVVAARRMGELFRALQSQIDDLGKRRLIEKFAFRTSNPIGNSFPIPLPQIDTAVKGLAIVKFARPHNTAVAWPTGFAWSSAPLGATAEVGAVQTATRIDFIDGLAVDTDYVMTLEVISG